MSDDIVLHPMIPLERKRVTTQQQWSGAAAENARLDVGKYYEERARALHGREIEKQDCMVLRKPMVTWEVRVSQTVILRPEGLSDEEWQHLAEETGKVLAVPYEIIQATE